MIVPLQVEYGVGKEFEVEEPILVRGLFKLQSANVRVYAHVHFRRNLKFLPIR